MSSKRNLSGLYIIAAGVLWGILSIFVKSLSAAGLTSLEIVAVRAFFAAVTLLIICCAKNPQLLKIRLRDIPLFLGTGIVSIVLFNTCYFTTIQISGVSTAALLLYTAPAMVMLLSIPILKEKFSRTKALALLFTVIGLVFITGILTSQEPISAAALLIGLGSGFGYAMYSIFGKFLVDKYDSLTITTYTFVVALLGLLPFLHPGKIAACIATAPGLASGAATGIVCTVLPFLFYTKGLKTVEAGKASILATVEPLVATVVGCVIFHEAVTFGKIMGIVFLFLAILILNLKKDC